MFFTKRKKIWSKKKKPKQETTHTYIRTKMHTPFEPQSYVTHLLPTQTPIHNMIYDIFDWYTTKISLCYTWFFHCLSGWRWSDVMWWPCSRDNEIHVSTAAVYLKNFPALECNLQRVFSHTFFNFPLIISPKHFAVRFLQAKDTFYFVKNVFFSPVMYSHLDPQTHISRQHFSVVSAPEREAKKHPPFFFLTRSINFLYFFISL